VIYDGFILTVRRGERWAVRGRKGAGKTTLLKIIAGVTSPILGACGWAIARMLYNPPNFLVLDEPTNHLDLATNRDTGRWAQRFRRHDGLRIA